MSESADASTNASAMKQVHTDPISANRYRSGQQQQRGGRSTFHTSSNSGDAATSANLRVAKPFAASGGTEEVRSGSEASSGNRWRKRHRWHPGGSRNGKHSRQGPSSTQVNAVGVDAVAATQVSPTSPAQQMRSSVTSHPKTPQMAAVHGQAAPPTMKREGTVSINRMVRCIDPAGGLSARSLKDMLRLGGNPNTDTVDTPCWGPKSEQQVAAEDANATSPLLAFTLDAIATPNTFAVFHPKKSGGGEGATSDETEEARCAAQQAGGIALQPAAALVPIEEEWMPQIAVESPYQFILRNFTQEGCFAFYDTPEARNVFLEKCYMICQQATAILEKEPLMSCVYAPVYVFGDIHGNFEDLSYFLKSVLAFNDIHLSPCNILCLGDYVDRGPYSLECAMILLALKIEAPHKVTLLRGNHEDRVVCGDRRTYGSDCFLAQCQAIFGPGEGTKLFKAVTGVFRHLPLAAEIVVSNAPNTTRGGAATAVSPDTVDPYQQQGGEDSQQTPNLSAGFHADSRQLIGSTATQWKRATDQRHRSHVERILCTHGGIPRFNEPPRDRDMLQFLRSPDFPRLLTLFPNNPTVREDPDASLADLDEETLQKAWYVMFDLMWSDPTADDTSCNINEWGFGFNTRGNNVVSFSAKAVDTFLDAFQYSMLFRAHQEKAHGIRLSKSQKVLTIFSSSNYLGHGNGAGCVIVNPQGQIQLIVKSSR